MTKVASQYKYFAFISYNSHDIEWGKKLQRKLEGYRMPATLCSEHGWKRKPIKPIFFAPTDIQPGGLNEELQERLKQSKNLIVICSPHSAKSEWVGKEIEFFHQLGRTENIHFFIVDGIPNSGNQDTECFNPVIKKLNIPEILGANINEKVYKTPWMNQERAYVQLITKLLGVEFDDIWKRHKRIIWQKIVLAITIAIMLIAIILAVWRANKPVEVKFKLEEITQKNQNLPSIKDAVVTITLNNEVKIDTLNTISDEAIFVNIPQTSLNKKTKINVHAQNFIAIDTIINLKKDNILPIKRDTNVYGNICVRLWSQKLEKIMSGYRVTINGKELTADQDGYIHTYVPLEQQNTYYEVIGENIIDKHISMPCGKNDIIQIK